MDLDMLQYAQDASGLEKIKQSLRRIGVNVCNINTYDDAAKALAAIGPGRVVDPQAIGGGCSCNTPNFQPEGRYIRVYMSDQIEPIYVSFDKIFRYIYDQVFASIYTRMQENLNEVMTRHLADYHDGATYDPQDIVTPSCGCDDTCHSCNPDLQSTGDADIDAFLDSLTKQCDCNG